MVATLVGDEAIIAKLHAKLLAGNCTLTQRYRILYSLRSCSNESAHQALITALKDDSALFRHDVAFALGQREDPAAVDTLKRVLFDAQEHCMVRHEAAEALGAIGTAGCLEPLQQCEHDSMREVSETCQLARQRMEFVSSHETVDAAGEGSYQSVDPTPPYPASMATDEVAAILLDDEHCLFDRYRALFALRNRGGTGAVQVLEQCFQPGNSALLKHEVAYVLGQMMDKQSVTCLKRVLLVRGHLNPGCNAWLELSLGAACAGRAWSGQVAVCMVECPPVPRHSTAACSTEQRALSGTENLAHIVVHCEMHSLCV